MDSAPAVKGDLPDVEPFPQPLNELLNVAVVDHIALGGLEKALFLPHIVGNVVAPDPEVEVVLWNPKVWEDAVFIILVHGREHQHKGCDVGSGGKVQPAVADPPLQAVLIGSKSAFVPPLHRHPAHSLFHPLIQAELPEGVLLGGILLGGVTRRPHLVDAHRDAQGGIGFLPHLGVRPIVSFVRSVDHRVEGGVDLPTLQNILGLLVCLIADGAGVGASRGDEEVERLHPGIAGAFGHNIEQLSVGLGVQLIKDHTVDVEAMLAVRLRRQHLVEGVGGLVDDAFLGGQNLHPLGEGRTHLHHVGGDLEHDGRLLAVSGTAVHLGPLLAVPTAEQKGHSRRQLRLAHLLRNFNVGGVELPIAVGLEGAEHIPDDLLLPVDQLEGLSGPGPLGVAEALDEPHSIVSGLLVVCGVLGLERSGPVFFQLAHGRSPPKWHKK